MHADHDGPGRLARRLERRAGSVGPAAGREVAIADEQGALLPVGQSGEVVIRCANVTAGYVGAGDGDAFFADGWFRTGDLGHVDTDGYLFLSGRKKEIINRGGETIAPRAIDEAILLHPGSPGRSRSPSPTPRSARRSPPLSCSPPAPS